MAINEDIATYQKMTDRIKLTKTMDLLGITAHAGQLPIVQDIDDPIHPYSNFVMVLGRRVGKSTLASTIAFRELLVPYSSTVLIAPSYRNASILFTMVLEYVNKTGLPVKSVNKNQFIIHLENNSKFVAATQSNIDSILGNRVSLVIYDETQSIPDVLHIHNQIILPTLLDYGVRSNGQLYAKALFLGTPRNTSTPLHALYLREDTQPSWKSYNAPSSSNPLLPRDFLEEQRLVMPPTTYKNEILAEFTSTGASVFFAFNPEVNLYDPSVLEFTEGTKYIIGLDFGFRDSTAAILVYITNAGEFYVHAMYQKESTATRDHVKAFRALESKAKGSLEVRYGDPSNPQMLLDLATSYNYEVSKANNRVAPALATMNELFQEHGHNKRPKLFINKDLKELIRQLKVIEYKSTAITGNPDPFKPDIAEGTHFDAVHALRYAIYTHFRRELAGMTIV
jgi:hypothetical protein